MSALTVFLILAAWLVCIVFTLAFIHGAQLLRRREHTHYRSDGPVSINPDRKESIYVRGNREAVEDAERYTL